MLGFINVFGGTNIADKFQLILFVTQTGRVSDEYNFCQMSACITVEVKAMRSCVCGRLRKQRGYTASGTRSFRESLRRLRRCLHYRRDCNYR